MGSICFAEFCTQNSAMRRILESLVSASMDVYQARPYLRNDVVTPSIGLSCSGIFLLTTRLALQDVPTSGLKVIVKTVTNALIHIPDSIIRSFKLLQLRAREKHPERLTDQIDDGNEHLRRVLSDISYSTISSLTSSWFCHSNIRAASGYLKPLLPELAEES